MGSKKGRRRGGQRPSHSYHETIAIHVANQCNGLIQDEVTKAKIDIFRDLEHTLRNYSLKMQAIQEMLLEAIKKDETELYSRMLDIEDDIDGYKEVDRVVELGDRVRMDAVDLADQEETVRKMMVNKCCVPMIGAGFEMNEQIEKALIGMKVGETKNVLTKLTGIEGEDEYNLKITVNRISQITDEKKRQMQIERAKKFERGEDPDAAPAEESAAEEIDVPVDVLKGVNE